MKKTTKKSVSKKVATLDPHTEEIKRYIGFVTETFQDRLSAIAEQISGLNQKIDSNYYGLLEKMDDNYDSLDQKIDSVHDSLNKKIDVNTEMLGQIMIQIEEIKMAMREKISREEFNKLESRLVSLEAIVFSGKIPSPTGARKSK